jgi:hypothetical protein
MIINTQQYNEWLICAFVAFCYTIAVLGICGGSVFSKRNARAPLSFIWIHSIFLAIVLGLTWLAVCISPSLPYWMTENPHKGSILQVLCVIAAALIAAIERSVIYIESSKYDADLDDSGAESNESGESHSGKA